jgi:hypothetical protein
MPDREPAVRRDPCVRYVMTSWRRESRSHSVLPPQPPAAQLAVASGPRAVALQSFTRRISARTTAASTGAPHTRRIVAGLRDLPRRQPSEQTP